jgi:hypothetical protein
VALASPIQNSKAKGQPANRRYQRFRDQHGRKWGAVIELKTGDPVGSPEPIGWTAPWMPDPKYVTVKLDDDGSVETGMLAIDYERALKDAKKEQDDHQERLEFFAGAIYSERAGAVLAEKARPAELMRYFRGSRPKPIEPIFAAMNGDRWLLGFEKGDPPEYLRDWFSLKSQRVAVGAGGELELDLDPTFLAEMDKAFTAQQGAKQRAREAMTPRQRELAERARADAELEARAAAERSKLAKAGAV